MKYIHHRAYGAPYSDSQNAGMNIDADSGESMKNSAATAGFKSAMRSCNRVKIYM
jgi:hypothetical protein